MSARPHVPAPTPAPIASLGDLPELGRAALDPAIWAWFEAAAGDGDTARRHRAAWEAIELCPRMLRPLATGAPRATRRRIAGAALPQPIFVAPTAWQSLAHADGEAGAALAAAAQGCGYVLSTQSRTPLEAVAHVAKDDPDRGPLWFQLYWQGGREATLALAERATRAGFEALVLTVDAPVQGPRDLSQRHGFRLPAGWHGAHESADAAQAASATGDLAALLARAPAWEDVAWLRERASLPLLLKGVLHPDDALNAARIGVAGVIVSAHGARNLDGCVAPAHALLAVTRAVRGSNQVPEGFAVLADGGIRRGVDVLRALALGADAVLVGRPVLWGLAHGGAPGVAQVLRLLRDEFAIAMVLCGCASIEDIGAHLLASTDRPALPPGALNTL